MTQPPMVRIVERATMDPWVATDETTNHISSSKSGFIAKCVGAFIPYNLDQFYLTDGYAHQ